MQKEQESPNPSQTGKKAKHTKTLSQKERIDKLETAMKAITLVETIRKKISTIKNTIAPEDRKQFLLLFEAFDKFETDLNKTGKKKKEHLLT